MCQMTAARANIVSSCISSAQQTTSSIYGHIHGESIAELYPTLLILNHFIFSPPSITTLGYNVHMAACGLNPLTAYFRALIMCFFVDKLASFLQW